MKKLSVLFIILCFTVLSFGQAGTKNIMYKGTDGRIYVVKEADLRPAISASTGNPDSLGGHLYTEYFLVAVNDTISAVVWFQNDSTVFDSVVVMHEVTGDVSFNDTLIATRWFKLNRETGGSSAILEIRGGNAADADIRLYADRGDENFDFWRIGALNDGTFRIYNQDAGKYLLQIDSTGTVHIADTLRADSVLLLKGINILSIVSDSTDSVKSAFRESNNVIFLDTTKTGVDYSDDFVLGVHVPGNTLYPVGQGFFFDNSKYAIGVGYDALSNNWLHEDSVGLGSISVGRNVRAPGAQAAAFGWGNVAGGTQSLVAGLGNKALGNVSIAFGQDMTVSGTLSIGISLDATTRVLSQSNTVAIMDGKVGIDTLLPDVKFHVKGGVKADSFLLGNVNLMDSTNTIMNDTLDSYAAKAKNEIITGFYQFNNGVYSAYFDKTAFFDDQIRVGVPTFTGKSFVTIKKELTVDSPNPTRGFRLNLHNDVEGLTGNVYGSEMFIKYETDSSYTTGEVFGYTSDVQMRANGTNTVGYFVAHADNYGTGNGVGLFITNVRARRTGNAYGIYIGEDSTGVQSDSGSAYVIYSLSTEPSYFAGRMQFEDTLFVNSSLMIDSTNILDIIGDSISYAKIDSMNLLGESVPFDWINPSEFYGMDEQISSLGGIDTMGIVASIDSFGFGETWHKVLTGRVPEDTASVKQSYRIFYTNKVPYGFIGIDSVQFKYRTFIAGETDTCAVDIALFKHNTDGSLGSPQQNNGNTSADIWVTESVTASTDILRYDNFMIIVTLASRGHAWYAKIADIRIYWRKGS